MVDEKTPTPENRAAGLRIRDAYLGAGMNRKQFATRIDAYYHQVLRWEAGHLPKPETLVLMANATGVTIDWILRGGASVEPELPESLLAWERDLAPRSYAPAQHRQRLLRTGFRYPPEEAGRWTSVWQLVLEEIRGGGQTQAGRDETAEAKRRGDELGLRDLPKKPPRKSARR